MYTAVILLCIGIESSPESCYVRMNNNLFNTREECMYAITEVIAEGILEITDMFGREHKVKDFNCVNWNTYRV